MSNIVVAVYQLPVEIPIDMVGHPLARISMPSAHVVMSSESGIISGISICIRIGILSVQVMVYASRNNIGIAGIGRVRIGICPMMKWVAYAPCILKYVDFFIIGIRNVFTAAM